MRPQELFFIKQNKMFGDYLVKIDGGTPVLVGVYLDGAMSFMNEASAASFIQRHRLNGFKIVKEYLSTNDLRPLEKNMCDDDDD